MESIEKVFNDHEVIVIGSGLGASAAAWKLSGKGKKILVLERGQWIKRDDSDWDAKKILVKSQYAAPTPIQINQYGRGFRPTPYNQNVGGMSVFYGGAAFRFRENDFTSWPLNYFQFEESYCQAEKALHVHGANPESPLFDSSSPPRSQNFPFKSIDLTGPSLRILEASHSLGLRPSAVPLALQFSGGKPQCIQCLTCDGFPCKIKAKAEASTVFLEPAIQNGLSVLTGIHILKFVFTKNKLQSIEMFSENDKQIRVCDVSEKKVILGAGALGSPTVLLRSNLNTLTHPGNLNLVGRRLMRHANAVVAGIFFKKINSKKEFQKQIALFDFYDHQKEESGFATGVIQDIYTPPKSALAALAPWGLRKLASGFQNRIQNLLCVSEDEPQIENRIEINLNDRGFFGESLPQIVHAYTKGDLERRNFLISKAKKILRKSGAKFFHIMEIDSFSHALGTLKFGRTPEDSVLDINCKMWGVENLWVLDASFMPSSAGVNPSLTIVANALRVAEKEF